MSSAVYVFLSNSIVLSKNNFYEKFFELHEEIFLSVFFCILLSMNN